MASKKNDELVARTTDGSLNYYENQGICGTATDRGLATRLGGHNYNVLTGSDRDEIYFLGMRHGTHFVDPSGNHSRHWFGARRRKSTADLDRSTLKPCLQVPQEHPRDLREPQRRLEAQLAQIENPSSYRAFRERLAMDNLAQSPRRYPSNSRPYEVETIRPYVTHKADFMRRREETMTRTISAPSIDLKNPAQSLSNTVRADARKQASQRQTESAQFAPWQTANTLAMSMDSTALGRQFEAAHTRCSTHRVENHDFAVARKNNHFSSKDKLTRADPFYMKPRSGITNNSVKYDIVSNERKWFKY